MLMETVSWERWMPILSWVTGWANVSGWVSSTIPVRMA